MIFYISILAISYLSGAIPFGLLIAKQRGIDVRAKGSGNIGATNVLRSVGKVEGALTLLADMLKGTIPAVVAYAVTGDSGIAAAAGTVAVLGHVFPVFLKFKGGKGVATALGVLAYITPKAALGGGAGFRDRHLFVKICFPGLPFRCRGHPSSCRFLSLRAIFSGSVDSHLPPGNCPAPCKYKEIDQGDGK